MTALWVLILFPLVVYAQVFIISNYPLRNSNLERVINMQNYKQMVEIIKSIEDVKDVYLMEEEDKVYIYVERYPIIRSIQVRGNLSLSREEILSYLGVYEGAPIRSPQFTEEDLKERIKRLYIDRGFLDASVGVTLTKDEDGYVDLYVGIDEGSVYFTESGLYRGTGYPPQVLDRVIGLSRGSVVKESLFREGVFRLQDFYAKEGFWDSFVYYEGLEKMPVRKPYLRVLLPEKSGILGSLSEGISNLFNYPFATLRALVGKGFVARPVFQITEGRRYRVHIEGAQFYPQDYITAVSGLEKKGVDPFSLEEAKENIIKAYHRKGFFDVEVDYRVDGENVWFILREGERYRVVAPGFSGEFYDEDRLEEFLNRELENLRKEGYTLSQGRINKQIDREKKQVIVDFQIDRGKRQILKDIVYEGENKDLRKLFKRHREKLPAIFNTDIIEALHLDIQRYFLKKGYMEGDYDAQVRIEEDENSVYYIYAYTVKEGPRYLTGETVYYGYRKTRLRELSYMTVKSKYYSETLSDMTLHNMLTSDLFSGVSIDTFIDKEKKQVHRLIQVSEDKRGIFDLSLGYNTEENLSLEAFLGLKNLFGVGITSGFRYRKTSKRELYDLSLLDNFLFSSRYWLKLNLQKTYEEHRSYELDSYGTSLQLGYRIGRNTSVGPVFSLLRNTAGGQTFHIKKYGLFLIRDFKDDPFFPSRINYNNINLSFAEGDVQYGKLELSVFYLIPLRRDIKLSFKLSGGGLWGKAPIFERFFLGGLKDLRGYSFEEVGQPNGGRYYLFGRFEFIVPLRRPFVGVLFWDAGSVAEKSSELTKKVKKDVGFATGIDTPIGPVRLDLAIPFEGKWYKNLKLYLSVGYYY